MKRPLIRSMPRLRRYRKPPLIMVIGTEQTVTQPEDPAVAMRFERWEFERALVGWDPS